MNIALMQRFKAMEKKVLEHEELIKQLTERIIALENKPRPGRPPKHE